MRVLITGGAGYIGYELVRALDQVDRIEHITVFDNLYRDNMNFFTRGTKLLKTSFVKGDVLNIYELEKVVRNQDVVIHLAAHVDFPFSHKDNFRYEQVNQYGTLVLYNLLERFPAKKLIYLSSAAVYGFNEVTNESTLPDPVNHYGISKLHGEEYMKLLEATTDVFILRCANVFGYNPMVRLDSVINNFMFEGLLYGKIKIIGTGEQIRPFIYLPNLVARIKDFVLEKKHEPGIYNVVEKNCSINELRDFMMDELPTLEFSYINSNVDIQGIKMASKKLLDVYNFPSSLKQTFNEFKNTLTVS